MIVWSDHTDVDLSRAAQRAKKIKDWLVLKTPENNPVRPLGSGSLHEVGERGGENISRQVVNHHVVLPPGS